MNNAATTNEVINQELIDRGIMPNGPAGSGAVDFIAGAAAADIDRFRGALLGGACGDALGYPITNMTPEQIRAGHGEVRDYLPVGASGRVGAISGDTQLTLMAADAVARFGDGQAPKFADLLVSSAGSLRQVGQGTRRAIVRINEGRPWWRSGNPSAGNGVAMRVAPLGLYFGGDVDSLRREVARNAVVTHADALAVASGIVQAYAVARLVRTQPGTLDPGEFIEEMVAVLENFDGAGGFEQRPGTVGTRVRLVDRIRQLGGMLELTPAEAFTHTHNGGYVLESLPAALWAFLANSEAPEQAIIVAANGGFDADTVAAMTGSLAGAYHGESGLPLRWVADLEAAIEIRHLANKLHRQSQHTTAAPAPSTSAVSVAGADRVHVAVLLDRSGSMASIADDTIGGFNHFLAEQRKLTGDCRISLIQFDGHDPSDVVADAIPVAEIPDLTGETYQPRGNTPLLDACGSLIERLDRRIAADPNEYQLVAVITDGHENSSREFARDEIAQLISERDDAGWTFIFLGANIDSFGEARSMGMQRGQAGDWDHTADGIAYSFEQVSHASTLYREADPQGRRTLQHRIMDEVREDLPDTNRDQA
ncbi:MAG: ADP-ribosylglycohydrolase [Candidatus Poriferisodalaceae bacterium]|jgi:ADP-ribosylglycohydrolase